MRVLEKSKISCRDIVKLMGDYADRELPPTLRARLDSHICECAACAKFKHTYQLTVQLASELEDKPVPQDMQNRLRKALNRRLGISLPLVP